MKEVKRVFDLLKEKQLTIGFVESMTGGNLSSLLVKHQGASQVLKGSLVVYSNYLKDKLLNITSKELEINGISSTYITHKMALKGHEILKSDIVVSVSGNADYTYNINGELKYCFSIKYLNKTKDFQRFLDNKNRVKNIKIASQTIYNELYNIIK